MAHSFRNVLLIATVVTLTILAGSCEAQDGDSSPGMSDDSSDSGDSSSSGSDSDASASSGSDSSVLPVPSATPGESGRVDLNNQPVTAGLLSYMDPAVRPARWTFFKLINYILINLFGQKMPCTVWSVTPMKIACTKLNGPTAMGM